MTIYEVPWVPRYVSDAAPRAVIAAAARAGGRMWLWVVARTHAIR
jgi:hypothetical protein